MKVVFKSVNIWQSYKQERGCLMHFARLANTLLKDEESVLSFEARFCLQLCQIFTDFNFFSLSDSAINLSCTFLHVPIPVAEQSLH